MNICTMNYSQALRGTRSRSGKLNSVLSSAEIELGRPMTNEERSLLSNRFPVDDVFNNLEKVFTFCVKFFVKYVLLLVWLWLNWCVTFHLLQLQGMEIVYSMVYWIIYNKLYSNSQIFSSYWWNPEQWRIQAYWKWRKSTELD